MRLDLKLGKPGPMTGPVSAMLADGRRLHLQHGPIDLIVEGVGEGDEIRRAYDQATMRFQTVLDQLVAELPVLRTACPPAGLGLQGPVARRMERAVIGHADRFITPMAAVAGAVADEILAALVAERQLQRAYVNNGGDIALYLAPGASFDVGVVAIPNQPSLAGTVTIHAASPVRGIATSGRHGRSLSLGIADAVTVFGENAAAADAAATLIANAVDLPGHPAIHRAPADTLDPDSDLGGRPVTVDVGPLQPAEIEQALNAGVDEALAMCNRGHVTAAVILLGSQVRVVGDLATDERIAGGSLSGLRLGRDQLARDDII